TGNIGYHHVHHFSPRVPNYHLEEVHESTEPFQQATTITFASSLKSIRFRLYDAKRRTFVSFKEAKSRLKQAKSDVQVQHRRTGKVYQEKLVYVFRRFVGKNLQDADDRLFCYTLKNLNP